MSYLLGFSVFLTLFISSLEKGFAVEENQLLHQHAHTVELNSLLPATSCSPSSSAKGHDTKKSPSAATVDKLRLSVDTKIPAQSGSVVGSGNYIVSVGLGSPKKMLSLIFDTGSDLTWTQCRPCAKSCYKQKEPIFDPATSFSYVNIVELHEVMAT